ncbi:MAG: efflux RND transporter periplasmic adaptor subunit [Prevotellaceae bacterium]|jgi:RND family efflux transporter MFP subunit|nr:efflux RND transporter periplasmic adaptor subunit [Prevotellaceae bacterium]
MKKSKQLTGMMLASLILFSSCNGAQEKKAEDAASEKVDTVLVKIDTVKLQPVEQLYSFTATVEPEAKNNIAASMPGRIVEILTEVGKEVQKGQVLVKMDPTSLLQAQTQLANLEVEYKRASELFNAGGAPKQVVDQLQVQLDNLRTTYKNLSENVNLVSPVSGVVTARNFDNGDMYSGAMPILTVMQIRPVKMKINVSETYFSQIKVGMSVDIRLDVYPDEPFTGKVSLIYPTIDASTHTFAVEVTIANANLRIRPGMYAKATLNFGTRQSIVVPDVAVQKQSGSNDKFVFTVENGTAKYHKVELGRRLADSHEILSGLTPGEIIVTAGQTRLIEGTPVEIKE